MALVGWYSQWLSPDSSADGSSKCMPSLHVQVILLFAAYPGRLKSLKPSEVGHR